MLWKDFFLYADWLILILGLGLDRGLVFIFKFFLFELERRRDFLGLLRVLAIEILELKMFFRFSPSLGVL